MSQTASHHPFVQEFERTLARDKAYIQSWMVSWEYQEQRRRRKKTYESGLPQDFYQFQGKEDLQEWVNWNMSLPQPDYFPDDSARHLISLAAQRDLPLFRKVGVEVDEQQYSEVLGRANMQDYRLAHFYPTPERQEPFRVMDFGSGFGRQANIWTQAKPGVSFLSMDAIPKSYCLQRFYYSQFGHPFKEYMADPEKFTVDFKEAIYHLPTWRFDLIPDNSLDLILCIQVLPELSGKLVKYLIGQFHRVLKPGGALLIRDGASWLRTGGGFVLDHHLAQHGWSLEFRPHVMDPADIHGTTRIWRKQDPQVLAAKQLTRKEKLSRMYFHFDQLSGGRLGKLLRRFA